MSNGKRPLGAFRAASLTRTTEEFVARRALRSSKFDTVPGRDARQWFADLRPRLLASRPMLSHGKKTKKLRDGSVQAVAPVFGKPTFQNRIDENGALV